MSYTLQAIVIPTTVRALVKDHGLIAVDLPVHDLCLVPLPYYQIDNRGIPFLPLTDGGEPTIGPQLDTLCQVFSARVKVAYVEAEFFGGDGTQGCALYENGMPLSGPMVHVKAINYALRWLGVQLDGKVDEFEAVGLGMHRNTEDWLEDLKKSQ